MTSGENVSSDPLVTKSQNFSENSIDWKDSTVLTAFICPIEKSVCFSPFYELKQFS